MIHIFLYVLNTHTHTLKKSHEHVVMVGLELWRIIMSASEYNMLDLIIIPYKILT